MRFDQSFLDEIRARLLVSQVVSRRVKLKRRGREFVGLSPFKQEKTPSFTVNDQKGFYHCFSSGEHGDIFTFLEVTEGLSFPEAVERLAGEAGLEMPRPAPGAERREQARDALRDINEAACAFFQDQLSGEAGGHARRYLDGRGVNAGLRERFRIGYAPNARHALKQHLAGRGFSVEHMARAGVLIAGEDIEEPYDRFRDRVVFPITDLKGRIIAFGGRALSPDAQPKYLNSPETPLFHKGATLFNAAAAREAAWERESVIVVEGYMDVIAMARAGLEQTVAPLGTALTEEQLGLLWRMAGEPVLCFDGDEAGRKAAWRALDTALPLLAPGKSLAFAFLPQGQDPDDLIAEGGAAAMQGVLGGAMPLVEALWARETESGRWTTPERRAALEDRLAGLLRRIADKRVRKHYGAAVAAKLQDLWGADERAGPLRPAPRALWKGGSGPRARPGFRDFGLAPPLPASRSLRESGLARGSHALPCREALIVLAMLNHPWLAEEHAEEVAALAFEAQALARLRDGILNAASGETPLDTETLRTQLSRQDIGAIVAQVERAITHKSDWFAEPGASREDVETGWRQVLALHRKSVALERELDAAERAYRAEESDEAFARLCDIRNQLLDLEGVEASIEGYGAPSGREAKPLS